MTSLKISNLGDFTELKSRLRGVKSPNKRKLVQAIKDMDYEVVITELLFRIELYAQQKVLNYTRADLNQIVSNISIYGIDMIVAGVMNKYYSNDNVVGDEDEYEDILLDEDGNAIEVGDERELTADLKGIDVNFNNEQNLGVMSNITIMSVDKDFVTADMEWEDVGEVNTYKFPTRDIVNHTVLADY